MPLLTTSAIIMDEDKTFCIFGDSVTQGAYIRNSWVSLLIEYLEKKYKDSFVNVFNLGIGGNTSVDLLKRFEFESSMRGPTDIIFAFGVNDSAYLGSMDKPIVNEKEFMENAAKLISSAKRFTKNIVFTGPVLGNDSLLKPFPGGTPEWSYDYGRVQKYNEMLKNIVIDNNCKFINVLGEFNESDFDDGLHPNELGHRKMYEVMKKYL